MTALPARGRLAMPVSGAEKSSERTFTSESPTSLPEGTPAAVILSCMLRKPGFSSLLRAAPPHQLSSYRSKPRHDLLYSPREQLTIGATLKVCTAMSRADNASSAVITGPGRLAGGPWLCVGAAAYAEGEPRPRDGLPMTFPPAIPFRAKVGFLGNCHRRDSNQASEALRPSFHFGGRNP
jgi:hypothetical protein